MPGLLWTIPPHEYAERWSHYEFVRAGPGEDNTFGLTSGLPRPLIAHPSVIGSAFQPRSVATYHPLSQPGFSMPFVGAKNVHQPLNDLPTPPLGPGKRFLNSLQLSIWMSLTPCFVSKHNFFESLDGLGFCLCTLVPGERRD